MMGQILIQVMAIHTKSKYQLKYMQMFMEITSKIFKCCLLRKGTKDCHEQCIFMYI